MTKPRLTYTCKEEDNRSRGDNLVREKEIYFSFNNCDVRQLLDAGVGSRVESCEYFSTAGRSMKVRVGYESDLTW